MRLLVCGGRNYGVWRRSSGFDENAARIFLVLDRFHKTRPVSVLIEGDAYKEYFDNDGNLVEVIGADKIAGMWARSRHIENLKFPANWKEYGKRAGYIRNSQMLTEGTPDAVLGFPGGNGTAMMIQIARKAGVPVWKAKP